MFIESSRPGLVKLRAQQRVLYKMYKYFSMPCTIWSKLEFYIFAYSRFDSSWNAWVIDITLDVRYLKWINNLSCVKCSGEGNAKEVANTMLGYDISVTTSMCACEKQLGCTKEGGAFTTFPPNF